MSGLNGTNAGFRYTPPGGSTKTHRLALPMKLQMAPAHRKRRYISDSLDGSAHEVVSIATGRAEVEATLRFNRNSQDLLDMLEHAADGLALTYYPDLSVNTSYALWLVSSGDEVALAQDQARYGLGEYEVRVRFRDASASGTSLESLFSPWLFKYDAGMAVPGAVFTRTGTAYQIGQFGVLESVATGLLRDGHWPLVDGVRSVSTLLEAARTNLVLQSEDFATTWVNFQSSESTNAVVAPDGATTADKLVESADSGGHHIRQNVTKAASARDYVFSVYLKAGERTACNLRLSDAADTNLARARVNLATGTITAGTAGGSFTHLSEGIEELGNGWYRAWLVATSNTETTVRAQVELEQPAGTNSYAGDGSSGIYLWGAQLEQADAPSSYIATTTGTAARGTETLYAPFTHAPQAMTVYVKFVERGTDLITNAGIVHIGGTNSGNDPRLQIHARGGGGYSFRYDDGTANAAASTTSSIPHGSVVEIVGQLTASGATIYQSVDGATATTATQSASFTFPTAFNDSRIYIGSRGTSEQGFADHLSHKVASGTKTLAEMRAL